MNTPVRGGDPPVTKVSPCVYPPSMTGKRQIRPSRLDILDRKSAVHNTHLIGLIRLTHIVTLVWLVTSPICTYFETGSFIDMSLARSAFSNFWLLMTMWFYAIIYSFTGYGLVCLRRSWNIPRTLMRVLIWADTSILMFSCITIVRAEDWSVFPSVFIMSVAVIHYMKIHSYATTVLDLEEYSVATAQSVKASVAGIETAHQQFCEEDSGSTTPASSSAVKENVSPGGVAKTLKPLSWSISEDVTLSNFVRFLFVPSLVYDVDFPKCNHGFRWKYFVGKTFLLFASLSSIFLVASNFVVPIMTEAHSTSYIHTFARLIVPLFLMDLLFFYTMFECILNMLAELTNYGDRDFYQDWWNSTTWEEFARKWNYPVHEFLLRHIYLKVYYHSSTGKNSRVKAKLMASIVTFMYSAIIHEFFLAATLGFISWYMIVIMMVQIPLFTLSKFHQNTTFGNVFFCFGISVGVPFIAMLYGTDWSYKLNQKITSTQIP